MLPKHVLQRVLTVSKVISVPPPTARGMGPGFCALHSILKFFVLDVVLNRVVAVSTDPAPDNAFALSFFGRPAGQLPWSHCTSSTCKVCGVIANGEQGHATSPLRLVFIPTATLLDHTLLTQGFMGISMAAFPRHWRP